MIGTINIQPDPIRQIGHVVFPQTSSLNKHNQHNDQDEQKTVDGHVENDFLFINDDNNNDEDDLDFHKSLNSIDSDINSTIGNVGDNNSESNHFVITNLEAFQLLKLHENNHGQQKHQENHPHTICPSVASTPSQQQQRSFMTTIMTDNNGLNREQTHIIYPSSASTSTTSKRNFEETVMPRHSNNFASFISNESLIHREDEQDEDPYAPLPIIFPHKSKIRHHEDDRDSIQKQIRRPAQDAVSAGDTPLQTESESTRPTKRIRSLPSFPVCSVGGDSTESTKNIDTQRQYPKKATMDPSSVSVPVLATSQRKSSPGPCPQKLPTLSADAVAIMSRMNNLMLKSAVSQSALQEWDKLNGLPRSHCQTMVNTARSRTQLQKGVVLPKWNGKPLIPGAKVSKSNRRRRNSVVT